MARLIDTSVFIEMERRDLNLPDILVKNRSDLAAIASISVSELLMGVLRANTRERQARRGAYLDDILRDFLVLPFDLDAARTHARLSLYLNASGQRIGAYDLIIAATALTQGLDLVTLNTGEFQRIPELVVVQPTWS